MNILITGGAGYIGSHVLKQLLEGDQPYNITVLDNLSTGNIQTIQTLQNLGNFTFKKLDLSESDAVKILLKDQKIDTIIHFAASIIVPESVNDPLKYYINNTLNTIRLIENALACGVTKFVFSSTAAVYGEPSLKDTAQGINENFPTTPINPYGFSKLMSEQVLQDVAKTHKEFKYVIFRYFNVAGADINKDTKPRIGQSFPNATHLIKIASECAVGKREKMYLFGKDYPTHDGTCMRDYIHVDDLASAHIAALEYLQNYRSDIFNLGYGHSYSVKEVIDTVKKVSGVDFTVEEVPRREGDPAVLIADNSKVLRYMNWKPRYDDLELICKSALEWEKINV